MSFPGPPGLGRSVVIGPDAPTPAGYASAPRFKVDPALVGDRDQLAVTVDELHRCWASRQPVVVELAAAPDVLSARAVETRPPWELGARFTFLLERLNYLVWVNSWDLRNGEPGWWWVRPAVAAGCTAGGPGDVLLPDGRPVWLDGGPRSPLAGLELAVVHGESLTAGRPVPVPAPIDPPSGGLAPDQLRAVAHGAGAARVIAPAGSGKTRTLAARLVHLLDDRGYEPGIVCAVAYNTRAKDELRVRLAERPGLAVRTIHSLGWEILREGRGGLRLLDEREQRALLDRLVPAARRPNTDVVGPYLEALGEVRIAFRAPDQVEESRDDVPDFVAVFETYRDELARREEADHDEQVFGAIEVLLADPALRRRWQARCRHLLVDEFQDLTPAYLLLLRLVASPGLSVFGVGDDDQTIYGYAGADPGFLIDYASLFPGASGYALEVNYRCPEPVVEAATTLLGHNRIRVAKTIRAGPGASADQGALRVEQADGDLLAGTVAGIVAGWLGEGRSPSEVAVLCRVNSALLPVHAALADLEIPFQSPLGPGTLDRTVLRAALGWMRIGLRPERVARADIFATVRRPSRGLGRVAADLLGSRRHLSLEELSGFGAALEGRQADRWDAYVADLETVVGAAASTSGALVDAIVHEVGLDRAAAALDAGRSRADRAAQSDDLVALRRSAALHPEPGDFEAWLRRVLAVSSSPAGVLLTTVHRVKGMEWPDVIVYGADRGLFPHALADDVEEERRVFHVAITRARRRLVVLADRRHPSPFLAEMAGAAPAPAAVAPAGRSRAKAEVASDAGPVDPVLVERLKEWRREIARTRGVPAYVVFHDSTLDDLARVRPQTEQALLRVRGIGPAKIEAYGDDLLALLAE